MRELMAAGLSGDALLGAMERIEARWERWNSAEAVDISAERRRAKDRERKRIGSKNSAEIPQIPQIPRNSAEDALSCLREDSKKERKQERGSRISAEWKPSEPDRQFARDHGCSEAEVNSEAAGFVDFWKAKPGKDGVKLDWSATWHNRIRAFCERKGKTPPPHIAEPDNPYLNPKHPQFEDYKHGWRPGMPTSAEMKAKYNGNQGDTGIAVAPVDARSNGAGAANAGMGRGGTRVGGGSGMESLFRSPGLDPDDSS